MSSAFTIFPLVNARGSFSFLPSWSSAGRPAGRPTSGGLAAGSRARRGAAARPAGPGRTLRCVRLGLMLGYQSAWSTAADQLALAVEADRLGLSVVWAAEAYGSDSVSMLSWIAGQTSRIDVGT